MTVRSSNEKQIIIIAKMEGGGKHGRGTIINKALLESLDSTNTSLLD